jgi:hypothetical protein
VGIFAAALHACGAAAAPPTDTASPILAIWRVQRFQFVYHSSNVYYSCEALHEKIRAILRAVGAHTQMIVDVGCMGRKFVNHAFIGVTLAAPTEATQESVKAATTFDSRQRLLARLHSQPLPTATDLERFPAQWRTVSLSHRRGPHLSSGDCELFDALRRRVFPRLAVRIDKEDLSCTSGYASHFAPRLEVTALMPATE